MATENSDTMAVQRKRARRVSFAETTSIRLFIRDKESDETETARVRDDSLFGGLDGDNDDNEDEEMDMRNTFLHPIRLPSPGGSTFGSASSNDAVFSVSRKDFRKINCAVTREVGQTEPEVSHHNQEDGPTAVSPANEEVNPRRGLRGRQRPIWQQHYIL
ncbi:hypothetical protein CASFOL_038577 [Castilleja foliolosa]|uniref:Uncharacterized protein n=1 Tax=Castilleja foliolosa TaxID=1961234 RepID=A0ABD3BMB5_9LAMI